MLNRLEATTYFATQLSGLSKPAQVRCSSTDQEIDVILKFKNSVRNREVSLAAEVICSLLASDLGLRTPVPYLVNVSAEFGDTVGGLPGDLMRRSIGWNFGSRFLAHASVVPPYGMIPEELHDSAADIFAFDVLI